MWSTLRGCQNKTYPWHTPLDAQNTKDISKSAYFSLVFSVPGLSDPDWAPGARSHGMIQEAESEDQGVEGRGKGGAKEARERPEIQGSGIYFTFRQKVFFVTDIWHSDIFISEDIGYIYVKIGADISKQRIIVRNCTFANLQKLISTTFRVNTGTSSSAIQVFKSCG